MGRWHGATVEEGTSVDVEPLGGRLVIFDSRRMLHISPISRLYLPHISPIIGSRRMLHAVRPAHGEERWALTVWI